MSDWSLPGFSALLAPRPATPGQAPAAVQTSSVDLNAVAGTADPNAKIFGCSDGCGKFYSQAEIDAAMAWTPPAN